MGRLESDLEQIKELATKEQLIHNRIRDNMYNVEYLSSLKIKDILPEGYEKLFELNLNDLDIELSVRSFCTAKRQSDTLHSIEKIKDEDLGTFLPWLYMDGPYTFELGGRQKREIMRTFVKELLIIYGVPANILEDIYNRGW